MRNRKPGQRFCCGAPSALIIGAALTVLLGTLCFAALRSGYSHILNTISELGEAGALHAHLVAFGFFLPVGLMVWLALWLAYREVSVQFSASQKSCSSAVCFVFAPYCRGE